MRSKGAGRSVVDRPLGVREAAGSNPARSMKLYPLSFTSTLKIIKLTTKCIFSWEVQLVVKVLSVDGEKYYVCEACGHKYEERYWAEKCEEFCTRHNACSLEIIRHAKIEI
jgi:hypothetical protein